ncbi:sodium/potassium/calcium exchanger 1-like [Asterias rubens]|uniref:sodium/potassium/calcium exchanger 1-like n=1 Tax=Asterias rubens TaxID=7604 RepID=UPI00145529A8|nr:sodium/potassium/calcium exchanger 1-like [Asterias rubens]
MKTLSVLIVVLIGTAFAQNDESNEQVDAAAQMGTDNAAGGMAGEVDRQGMGVFFGNIGGKVVPKPQMTGQGEGDVESTEAGGAAMEAAAVAEQNGEEEETEEKTNEQNEPEEESEAAEAGEENEEMEGEEADGEESTGGMPVMDGEENEETPAGGTNPFIAINGGQPEGEGMDAPEMVGGDGEGAEMGEAGDESSEVSEGAAQTAGVTTDSEEEQGAAIGQQSEADVESSEVAEESEHESSSVMTTSGGVPVEEVPVEKEASVDNEAPMDENKPVDIEEPVDNKATEDTESTDLKLNKLAEKAKQLSDGVTTEQPGATTPPPTEDKDDKTSQGLSDATKTRIAISVSSIGAVALVGVIAMAIGKHTQRRPNSGPPA